MKTVREYLSDAAELGCPFARAVVVCDGRVKADYSDVQRLEDGILFDSCLELKTGYAIGSVALLFVKDMMPNNGIDKAMSKKRRKWLSYSVSRYGKVTVELVGGQTVEAKSFDELDKALG